MLFCYGALNMLEQTESHTESEFEPSAVEAMPSMEITDGDGCMRRLYLSKMAAVHELSLELAHDVNNPLAVLSVCAERLKTLLVQTNVTDDRLVRLAEMIERNTTRISSIIRGLNPADQAYEDGGCSRVGVQALLTQILASLTPRLACCQIDIHRSGEDVEFMVNCQVIHLRQAVLNVLTNAIEAVRSDGSAERWIAIDVREQAESIAIAISDSGPGVPTSIVEKIMRPFFSTKPPEKNAGLGLSLSAAILEANGGRLYLDPSAPHTCFIISLPKVSLQNDSLPNRFSEGSGTHFFT